MAYATVQDVGDSLGRPITDPDETTQVTAWLARVENRIRARIVDFDVLVADSTYLSAVTGVEVDVVIRRINNPSGMKSERVDDYSFSLSDAASSSDLWPTDAEWSELTPYRSSGAFSITPRYSS